jgi:hypothetical protein
LSDKWVTVYQFIQCNIPEDLDLQQHYLEPQILQGNSHPVGQRISCLLGHYIPVRVLQKLSLLGVLSQVNPIHWRYVALLACNQDKCDNALRYLPMWWEGKHLSLHDEVSESDSYSYNKSQ